MRVFGDFPDDSLVVESAAGLGNRMMALEGAIMLGRELGKRVYLSWPRDFDCDCRFADLFEVGGNEFEVLKYPVWQQNAVHRPIPRMAALLNRRWGVVLSRKWQMALRLHKYRFDASLKPRRIVQPGGGHTLVDVPPMEDLRRLRRIYMRTYFNVYYDMHPGMAPRRYDHLRPVAEIRERVEEITGGFGGRTVGVHIRWGWDEGWVRRKLHPISAFIRAMRAEIEQDSSTRFYLATLSPVVSRRLKVLFGDRIQMQPELALGTDSVAGMKSAVVDMWALGATRKIIGSRGASFSLVASQLEDIDLALVDVSLPGGMWLKPRRDADTVG